jgi:guanine deaminase
MMDKNELMQKAIRLAVENVGNGRGGPFAALVVRDGEIIATGANAVTSANDPTAHAEIVAIRNACSKLGRFELSGCEIYSSSEPCPMCLGAIYWARPDRVYFGALAEDAARAGFCDKFIGEQIRLPYGKQRIPIEQLPHDDALLPFQAWQEKTDKIPY